MTHIPQDLPSRWTGIADQQLLLPLPPASKNKPIPLPAVWMSLSPQQQQRLFQQLVRVCCRLLQPQPQSREEEETDEPA
jgi:hypothetical protein